MTHVSHTASYVRSDDLRAMQIQSEGIPGPIEAHGHFDLPATSRRIWDLLETPQTVDSICRVLSHEFPLDHRICPQEVAAFLAELSCEDLIQLSPDS